MRLISCAAILAACSGLAFAANEAPKPLEAVRLVYPYDLALAGTEGRATIQFNIDASGLARDVTVAEATLPEFGHAAKSMVEAERFEPALENGKAVERTGLQQEVVFNHDSLDAGAQAALAELKKPQPDLAKARDLDKLPPALLRAVSPVFPPAMLASAGRGEAVIECVIDAQGHVQLPRIVSATTEDCGWAAATAVVRWEFAPPTRGGKPVAIRMRIPLEFAPPKAETEPGK